MRRGSAGHDEGNDRRQAFDLFDALGSDALGRTEKTLHADTGWHTGVPAFEGGDAARFLARHLRCRGRSG